MILVDPKTDTVYVPLSGPWFDKLRAGWSEPVRVRVQGDELVFRSARAKPVKGVYITPDEDDGA